LVHLLACSGSSRRAAPRTRVKRFREYCLDSVDVVITVIAYRLRNTLDSEVKSIVEETGPWDSVFPLQLEKAAGNVCALSISLSVINPCSYLQS